MYVLICGLVMNTFFTEYGAMEKLSECQIAIGNVKNGTLAAVLVSYFLVLYMESLITTALPLISNEQSILFRMITLNQLEPVLAASGQVITSSEYIIVPETPAATDNHCPTSLK